MADESAGDKPGEGKPEAKAEGPRKPRGPVLLEAIFAGAQILTSVTGATVFATALPEIIPNMPDDTTHTLAGPPEKRPAAIGARSMNRRPSPVICARMPNSTKWNT